jgi:hypothetical protein
MTPALCRPGALQHGAQLAWMAALRLESSPAPVRSYVVGRGRRGERRGEGRREATGEAVLSTCRPQQKDNPCSTDSRANCRPPETHFFHFTPTGSVIKDTVPEHKKKVYGARRTTIQGQIHGFCDETQLYGRLRRTPMDKILRAPYAHSKIPAEEQRKN